MLFTVCARNSTGKRAPHTAEPDGQPDADCLRLRRRHLDGRPRGRHGATLVAGYGLAGAPYFSPDGSSLRLAQTTTAIPTCTSSRSVGGEPQRLTFHPGADVVTGWTHDGSRIVFLSRRNSPTDASSLHDSDERRHSRCFRCPDAQGGAFSLGWHALGVRSERAVGTVLARLSRRTRDADLDRKHGRFSIDRIVTQQR